MGRVEPLARVWAVELARKLDAPGLALSFRELWAHDQAGRAQAFKSLAAGGDAAGRCRGGVGGAVRRRVAVAGVT